MSSDWEARYRAGDTPWDKGEPSPGLVDFLADHRDLPGKTVCIPGCGFGRDVIVWAQAGFEATGCDFAPSAVAGARANVELAEARAAIIQANFLTDSGPERYD